MDRILRIIVVLALAVAATYADDSRPDGYPSGSSSGSDWGSKPSYRGPGPGPAPDIDTARWWKDQAMMAYWQQQNRLGFMMSRLEAGKNPRAFQIADEIRSLLSQARARIDEERYREALGILSMTYGLFSELSRLAMEPPTTDPNRPATSQNALAEVAALHARLQDHLYRLRDRPGYVSGDERIPQLQAKVQELLDKCKESLAAGKADAAKEFGLKAEALLAELHQVIAGSGNRSADPARLRIEERLHRAREQLHRLQTAGGDADRLAMAGTVLEQARAAVAAGNLPSAESLAHQAEKLLSERGATPGNRLSASAFDRLQGKLDRARALVKASGNEKAARILEKGLEHFGKAERFRSENQAARAEAEMDIALKLAAKAVDIARTAER